MSEFNEFKPRFKSPKNRFQFSAGLNLEKFNTILNGTNLIWDAASALGILNQISFLGNYQELGPFKKKKFDLTMIDLYSLITN